MQAYLAERSARVDVLLDRAIPPASEAPQPLHAAMRHLVFPGGKRLRPALCCAAGEALGAPTEACLPMAAAVELVHTYSLVHDDLPCMDDDRERRGRATVHLAFGEATAVLAGDALLAAAFELLASSVGPAERRVAALGELARAAGARHLVGGQADDLTFAPGETDAARVESVHRRKSAALIAASVVGGAILAGAEPAILERLRRFGLATGVGFQIADDLLDRDEQEACSLVRVLGTQEAARRAEHWLEQALDELEDLGEPAEPLRELARYAVRRDR